MIKPQFSVNVNTVVFPIFIYRNTSKQEDIKRCLPHICTGCFFRTFNTNKKRDILALDQIKSLLWQFSSLASYCGEYINL